MSPVKKFVGFKLFPGVMILVGILSFAIGVQTMAGALASRDWPSTDGMVVATRIDIESSSSSSSRSSRTYRPIIIYDYAVDGVSHSAQRVAFGEYATGDPADAEKVRDTYPEGKQVPVYYDPGSPENAVLEPGLHGIPWFFIVLGLVFAGIGALMAKFFPRMFAEDKPS